MSLEDPLNKFSQQQLDADAELAMAAAGEAASMAIRAGARAPLFALENSAGQIVAFGDLLRKGPVVLHFFRGTWCSFGEENLAQFSATSRRILSLGANSVAIAPSGSFAKDIGSLQSSALLDSEMKVARQYGLAFTLPVSLRQRYESLGYTPPPTKNPDHWLVPLPATYLVNTDGIVVLAYIDVDYRKRFEMESLFVALKALRVRRESVIQSAKSLHSKFD